MLGPSRYIQYKILPRFWDPKLRAMGVHHAAMTWMSPAGSRLDHR